MYATKSIMEAREGMKRRLIESLSEEQLNILDLIKNLDESIDLAAKVEVPVGGTVVTDDESASLIVKDGYEGKRNLSVSTLLELKDQDGNPEPLAVAIVGAWEHLKEKHPELNGVKCGKVVKAYTAKDLEYVLGIIRKYKEDVDKCKRAFEDHGFPEVPKGGE